MNFASTHHVGLARNRTGFSVIATALALAAALSAGTALAQPQLTVVHIDAAANVAEGDLIDYGNVLQGELLIKQYILANTGNQNLTIQSVVLLGQQTFDWDAYPIAAQLPNVLAPGQQMNIGVEFAPPAFHNPPVSSVLVQIDSSAPDAPRQFQVRGTVLEVPLVAALAVEIEGQNVPHNGAVDLGEVTLGETYEIEMIADSIGQIPLTLLGVQLAGDDAADFQVLDGGHRVLQVGDSHTLRLSYTPTVAGQASAIARIFNNSALTQYTINFTAEVIDPAADEEIDNGNDNQGNNGDGNGDVDDNENDNGGDDEIVTPVPVGGMCGAGANMSALAWAAALCGLGMGRRMQSSQRRRR